ncbi:MULTISPECIES: glycosyltransferase family 2 protein [Paenibacillus]|uniref:Glycosyltransferase family 2 protein n=1 Tax=Paenibacillus xylanilyticus TaxID=248903 RepID=A0A7Y6BU79_9BACL|nr:glycosyltransferase family 2 protein [Paenibacillus xylanilyticus]NUU75102.1 glycosyltransferase family 2 protein [Paenibacillus xylanilyticus]
MNSPLVSILIPAYNRPDTLRIALESVLEQTYSNLEIIICDDSTNNEVQKMLMPYLHEDVRIKYFKNDKNLYLGNWHKCFNLASGLFVNYLMDDDVFHKEKIERMLYYYQNFENISLVTSYRNIINEQGEILPPIYASRKLYEETRILDGYDLANHMLSRCLNVIGEPTTVLFHKKDLIHPFGTFNGRQYSLLNDVASWLNLLSKGKAVYIADGLSSLRKHQSQNNQELTRTSMTEWLDIVIASRDQGYLHSDVLFRSALHAYRLSIQGRPQIHTDLERIEALLSSLNG